MPSVKTRLWSNNAKIRFSFPVHELVTPSLNEIGIKPQPCTAVIHHYGKLNQSESDTKGEKYYHLGLKKLDEIRHDQALIPLRELAIQAGILKHYKQAAELWQRVLELDQDNAEAHLNLGTALFSLGKITEALQSAKQATKLKKDLKEGHFNYALYELHLGRSAAAVKKLTRLRLQEPEYLAAKFMQAAALCCQDGIKAGRKAFNKIMDKNITEEMITVAGSELAESLTKAGREKDAEKIKKATSL